MKVEWVFTQSASKFGKFYTLPPIYSRKQDMLGSRTELNVKKEKKKKLSDAFLDQIYCVLVVSRSAFQCTNLSCQPCRLTVDAGQCMNSSST